MSDERVLQVWEETGGTFGGRLLSGAADDGRRYQGCLSADGVRALAVSFGERVDRIETLAEPVPWPFLAAAQRGLDLYAARPELPELNVIRYLARLNTTQRKRLVDLIANLPRDERMQFIEHCNDLAAAVSRTLLGKA